MLDRAAALQATLRASMTALEAQRTLLGDAAVEAALAPLRAQCEALAQGREAPPPAAAWRQLRQVSVLFLDVAGSTALSGRIDVEDLQAALDGTLAACSALVRAAGGEVLQYAGDSLLAAFGAAGAREDDAERAVRCALALAAEGARQGEALRARLGAEGFAVRLGVHTGPVLRGGGVNEDNTLRGLAVNVAARMEQTAPPGRVRVSHDTWTLVRGLFDAEPQAAIAVHGVDEPVRSWLVRAARPRQFRAPTRGIEGVATPLVGREPELAALEAAWQAVLATRDSGSCTVLAEAGLGKSRLLHEWQQRLAAAPLPPRLLAARSQPADRQQPYGLVRALLAALLGIADSDAAEAARARLVEGLTPWLAAPDDPAPELLGQLVGMDFGASPAVRALGGDGRLLRGRALTALALVLRRLAQRNGAGLVLLLDDLQWADDASLDALPGLLRPGGLPLLAVCGARPALLERRAQWCDELPGHRRIELAALGRAARRALVTALLQRLPGPPPALVERVEQRSEGNPFYAEELVKMLVDRGVIEAPPAGPWRFAAEQIDTLPLPPTLTGVLQARLDALAPAERRALQHASIVGPVFWDDALGALDGQAPRQLPALRRKALVHRHAASAFEGTDEQAFHHHLLHQATYDTLLRSERREGHARAATWLEARVGERAGEYLAVTAEHFERAGDHDRAREWFDRAAVAAGDRMAMRMALVYLDRALALPEPQPEKLGDLLNRRIAALDALGLRERQAADIAALRALAGRTGHQGHLAKALMQQALLADRLGHSAEGAALARQVLALSESAGDAVRCALAWGQIAWSAIESGQFDQARHALARGLPWARRVPLVEHDAHIHVYEVQLLLIAAHLYAMRHADGARARSIERALRRARRHRIRRMEALCLEWLVDLAADRGDVAAAAAHLESMRVVSVELDLPLHDAVLAQRAGRLALLQNDLGQASRESARAAALYQAQGSPHYAASALEDEAMALRLAGRCDEAADRLQAAADAWQQLGDVEQAAAATLLRAEARLAAGAAAEALATVQALQPLLGSPRGIDAVVRAPAAHHAAWRVLHAAGDPRARAQLERACVLLDERLRRLADDAARARALAVVPLYREIAAAAAAAGLGTWAAADNAAGASGMDGAAAGADPGV